MVTIQRSTVRSELPSFERSLRDLSLNTQRLYRRGVTMFATFLEQRHLSGGLEAITRAHVEEFIDEERQRTSAASAGIHYRSLQAFFKWAIGYELLEKSPLNGVRHPKVIVEPVHVLEESEIAALLATCERDVTFIAKRDTALIRVLLAGLRRSEAADLKVDDVDLDAGVLVVVHGKGGKTRRVPLGTKTLLALDRYLRARSRQSCAGEPYLFIGHKGRLTSVGVRYCVIQRAKQAGVTMHVHTLRHTAAHNWLASGGSETGLMKALGWSSSNMLRRYAASTAEARMLEEAKRIGFGD